MCINVDIVMISVQKVFKNNLKSDRGRVIYFGSRTGMVVAIVRVAVSIKGKRGTNVKFEGKRTHLYFPSKSVNP